MMIVFAFLNRLRGMFTWARVLISIIAGRQLEFKKIYFIQRGRIMEKQINLPLIDCIVELTNKQIAGLGDGFIDMNTNITIDDETIDKAKELKKQKEDFLKQQIIINEAKAYLANTDYKMLPNYVPKADEDLDAIIAKRNETREFIRNNNA